MKIRSLLASLTLCCIPLVAFSGVNLKNGGYFITFKHEMAPEDGLSLSRTYNSISSTATGWLGQGWGTLFETRATVLPEGTVAVTEYGSGLVNFYRPAQVEGLDAAVERLVAASGQQGSAADAAELRQQLLASEELRLRQTRKLGLATPLPLGIRLRGDRCAEASLTHTAQGLERVNCDHSIDLFDAKGRMLSRRHPSGARLSATYVPGQALPAAISDDKGASMTLSWTGELLSRIQLADAVVHFTHDAHRNLIQSVSPGNGESYEYDANSNLTLVRFLDDTTLRMRYDAQERVIQETDRVGQQTTYDYLTDPATPDTRTTRVTHTDHTGKVSVRETTYQLATSKTGSVHTASVHTREGNTSSAITLDERSRLIAQRRSDGDRKDLIYHPRTGKLLLAIVNGEAISYHYDEQGQLALLRGPNERTVRLGFDAAGRVSQIHDRKPRRGSRQLTLGYNARGQLATLDLLGFGQLQIKRDAQGEIAQLVSSGARGADAEIARAFYQLLPMFRAAALMD